jgi:uncharacterized protein (AIM24 family)
MEYKIMKEPIGFLKLFFKQREKVMTEVGSLGYMKGIIQSKTKTKEGSLIQKIQTSGILF